MMQTSYSHCTCGVQKRLLVNCSSISNSWNSHQIRSMSRPCGCNKIYYPWKKQSHLRKSNSKMISNDTLLLQGGTFFSVTLSKRLLMMYFCIDCAAWMNEPACISEDVTIFWLSLLIVGCRKKWASRRGLLAGTMYVHKLIMIGWSSASFVKKLPILQRPSWKEKKLMKNLAIALYCNI